MIELLQNLIKLQALDFGAIKDKNTDTARAGLAPKFPHKLSAIMTGWS